MIFCRSTHSDSACLTFGSSSSRFLVLYGFEFHVMFVVSAPGTMFSFRFACFLTSLIASNGTWSTHCSVPCSRSAIIASAFV